MLNCSLILKCILCIFYAFSSSGILTLFSDWEGLRSSKCRSSITSYLQVACARQNCLFPLLCFSKRTNNSAVVSPHSIEGKSALFCFCFLSLFPHFLKTHSRALPVKIRFHELVELAPPVNLLKRKTHKTHSRPTELQSLRGGPGICTFLRFPVLCSWVQHARQAPGRPESKIKNHLFFFLVECILSELPLQFIDTFLSKSVLPAFSCQYWLELIEFARHIPWSSPQLSSDLSSYCTF